MKSHNASDILAKAGELSETDREMIDVYASRWGVSHFEAILDGHFLSSSQLADKLSECMKLERVYSVDPCEIDAEALAQIPFRLAVEEQIVPLRFHRKGGVLKVLLADPTRDITRIERSLGISVSVAVGEKSMIQDALIACYPLEEQLPSIRRRQVDEKRS